MESKMEMESKISEKSVESQSKAISLKSVLAILLIWVLLLIGVILLICVVMAPNTTMAGNLGQVIRNKCNLHVVEDNLIVSDHYLTKLNFQKDKNILPAIEYNQLYSNSCMDEMLMHQYYGQFNSWFKACLYENYTIDWTAVVWNDTTNMLYKNESSEQTIRTQIIFEDHFHPSFAFKFNASNEEYISGFVQQKKVSSEQPLYELTHRFYTFKSLEVTNVTDQIINQIRDQTDEQYSKIYSDNTQINLKYSRYEIIDIWYYNRFVALLRAGNKILYCYLNNNLRCSETPLIIFNDGNDTFNDCSSESIPNTSFDWIVLIISVVCLVLLVIGLYFCVRVLKRFKRDENSIGMSGVNQATAKPPENDKIQNESAQ